MGNQNSNRAQERLRALMAADAAVARDRAQGLDYLISSSPAPVVPSPSRNVTPGESAHIFNDAYRVAR
jgi:hypothetical protein